MGGAGIQFLSTIILARILTPDDFGIIGMCSIFLALSNMIVDSEMGGALLRKKNTTSADFHTLFVYNLLVSILLYGILYAISPLVSSFYNRTELIDVIRVLSITVVIQSFRIVQRVILFRNLKFHTMALINLISGSISLALAIFLALKSFSYWAIVWQQVSGAILSTILFMLATKFIPRLSFSVDSFKKQFSFGISLLGADILKILSTNISSNLIAKFMPLHITGCYVQSMRISNYGTTFLSSIMDQTIYPYLAKKEEKQDFYLKYLILLFEFGCISTVFLFSFSKEIIYMLLGEKWSDAVPIFALLSLALLPNIIQVCVRILFKAEAVTNVILKIQLAKSIIVLFLLFIGLNFGLTGVVLGYVIAENIIGVLMLGATKKYLNVSCASQTAKMCIYWVIMLLILSLCFIFKDTIDDLFIVIKLFGIPFVMILLNSLSGKSECINFLMDYIKK